MLPREMPVKSFQEAVSREGTALRRQGHWAWLRVPRVRRRPSLRRHAVPRCRCHDSDEGGSKPHPRAPVDARHHLGEVYLSARWIEALSSRRTAPREAMCVTPKRRRSDSPSLRPRARADVRHSRVTAAVTLNFLVARRKTERLALTYDDIDVDADFVLRHDA